MVVVKNSVLIVAITVSGVAKHVSEIKVHTVEEPNADTESDLEVGVSGETTIMREPDISVGDKLFVTGGSDSKHLGVITVVTNLTSSVLGD